MSEPHHVVPVRTYVQVFAALMVLTLVTVGVAFINLGPMNTFAALAIAGVKGMLVLLIFMHLKFSSRLNAIVACSAILWLVILIGFTVSDFFTRGWLPIYK